MATEGTTNDRPEIEVISEEEWESMPPPKPAKKPDAWDETLGMLESGKIVRITVKDASKLKGIRIGLGRRAIGRGFRIESRVQGDLLAVKRSDKEVEKKAKAESGNGRRQKKAAETESE